MSAADKTKLDAVTPGGGVDTVANVGNTPNAGGATISGNTLQLQPASATQPGVVVPGAQNLGATKTISGAILNGITTIAQAATGLIRAAAVSLVLRSSLGASSSDVGVKVGVETSDGSTHSDAKLWGAYTGLGGAELLRWFLTKQTFGIPASAVIQWADVWGTSITAGSAYLYLNSNVYARDSLLMNNYWRSSVAAGGRVDQWGWDSTATPGNTTIGRPIGRSAIATGSAACVITNSLVTAGMHCIVTPHARDATCKELIAVCGAGTITVSGSANATATLPFSWEVKGFV